MIIRQSMELAGVSQLPQTTWNDTIMQTIVGRDFAKFVLQSKIAASKRDEPSNVA